MHVFLGSSLSHMQRFRGGLVFKVHRLVYHSTIGLGVMKQRKMTWTELERARRCATSTISGSNVASCHPTTEMSRSLDSCFIMTRAALSPPLSLCLSPSLSLSLSLACKAHRLCVSSNPCTAGATSTVSYEKGIKSKRFWQ